uniref:Putative LOV domain-containing protein n=1 Tax=Synura petersenii TaxID=52555 RepID=A0A126WWA7_9STRA|nr:putative LOV domain-containing protein [Synura petersenii]
MSFIKADTINELINHQHFPTLCLVTVTFLFARFLFLREDNKDDDKAIRTFISQKKLCPKDQIVVDMLGMNENKNVCYLVTDPDLDDNPIVFTSEGFCKYTGYEKNEIEGRNCRFLQGAGTDPKDISLIRDAIRKEIDVNVCIQNYCKNGKPFMNQFFMCPLRDENKKLAYFLGVQVVVPKKAPGQQQENPGWIYTMGNHE